MRVRNVEYFLNHLESKKSKAVGPRNDEELGNYEIALFYAEKNKTPKKVAA